MSVPDPNFFGGKVEFTIRDGEWRSEDSSAMYFSKPNWCAPSWPTSHPMQANYRCLGHAEQARSGTDRTVHRSNGRLALNVLEVMHAILQSAETHAIIAIGTQIERPLALSHDEVQATTR
jgi:hypothetical protein